jgi:hypothetical protein
MQVILISPRQLLRTICLCGLKGLGSLFRYLSRKSIFGQFRHFVFETELVKHRVPAQKVIRRTRRKISSTVTLPFEVHITENNLFPVCLQLKQLLNVTKILKIKIKLFLVLFYNAGQIKLLYNIFSPCFKHSGAGGVKVNNLWLKFYQLSNAKYFKLFYLF